MVDRKVVYGMSPAINEASEGPVQVYKLDSSDPSGVVWVIPQATFVSRDAAHQYCDQMNAQDTG